jgi:hypothetical protein
VEWLEMVEAPAREGDGVEGVSTTDVADDGVDI